MLPLGAIIVISTFAAGMAASGIVASTIVYSCARDIICNSGIVLALAFIAQYIISKVCEI
ncbi:hypothetical protein [Wolbachia pipientis]|uniref:hypothetical protein n=1 Tax=Wolbachia pipientis TaxID=955 RepID=UPI0025A37A3C|nr:hypothetical protein [Wolbachia pipientis]MDM8334868.1 hypothetical protein [Wolbachia pipientis]